jgi:hypothetical protein
MHRSRRTSRSGSSSSQIVRAAHSNANPAQLENLSDVRLPVRTAAGDKYSGGVQTLRGAHRGEQCVLSDGLRSRERQRVRRGEGVVVGG